MGHPAVQEGWAGLRAGILAWNRLRTYSMVQGAKCGTHAILQK
jgi:hypothetical protein